MNLLNSDNQLNINIQALVHSDSEGSVSEIEQRSFFDSRALLDKSLNNKLELFEPPSSEQERRPLRTRQPQETYVESRRPVELYDFSAIEDHKALSHSGIDYIGASASSKQLNYSHIAVEENGEQESLMSGSNNKSNCRNREEGQVGQWIQKQRQAMSEEEEEQQGEEEASMEEPKKSAEEEEEEPEARLLIKNETKNIPKNYGKAIITFIEKQKDKVTALLEGSPVSYADLLGEFKYRKKNINTIKDLKHLWLGSKYAPVMRKLSNLFLRKYSLQYIFNSRITNYSSHIKYRHKLREALSNPEEFNNIKDY